MKQIYPLELKRKINVKSAVTVITYSYWIKFQLLFPMHCLTFCLAELNDTETPTESLATHKNSNLIKLEYLEFNLKLGFQSLENLLPRKIILEKWTAGDKIKLAFSLLWKKKFKFLYFTSFSKYLTRYRVSKNTDSECWFWRSGLFIQNKFGDLNERTGDARVAKRFEWECDSPSWLDVGDHLSFSLLGICDRVAAHLY